MGLRDLIVGFISADTPLDELEPYRRASSDAYSIIDEVSPASWARLAAWNAFLLQVYADNLVAAGSTSRYCAPDIASFAKVVYAQANVWIEEARKAQASDSYRFVFRLPHPLPHWSDPLRSGQQLTGMRGTLETGRTRVASDLAKFAGEESQRGILRVRLAEIDAEATYIERLWTAKPTYELRGTLGDSLAETLDHIFELGHLLSQPELIRRLF